MSGLHGDALIELAERLSSREEFIIFANALADNLKRHPEEWHNATLAEFIQALAGFVSSMNGYYANLETSVNYDTPSWRVLADILLASRVYE